MSATLIWRLVRGPSTEPTLIPLVATRLAARGLSISEICSENLETFDVWRTLAATGVKGYMNRVTYASQVMRPWGPLLPCTPQMLPSKYCQR